MMGRCVDRGPRGIRILILFVVCAFAVAFLSGADAASACRDDALSDDFGLPSLCLTTADAADGLPKLQYESAEPVSAIAARTEADKPVTGVRALACVCEPTRTVSNAEACSQGLFNEDREGRMSWNDP
jgi:hypothetical protein